VKRFWTWFLENANEYYLLAAVVLVLLAFYVKFPETSEEYSVSASQPMPKLPKFDIVYNVPVVFSQPVTFVSDVTFNGTCGCKK